MNSNTKFILLFLQYISSVLPCFCKHSVLLNDSKSKIACYRTIMTAARTILIVSLPTACISLMEKAIVYRGISLFVHESRRKDLSRCSIIESADVSAWLTIRRRVIIRVCITLIYTPPISNYLRLPRQFCIPLASRGHRIFCQQLFSSLEKHFIPLATKFN